MRAVTLGASVHAVSGGARRRQGIATIAATALLAALSGCGGERHGESGTTARKGGSEVLPRDFGKSVTRSTGRFERAAAKATKEMRSAKTLGDLATARDHLQLAFFTFEAELDATHAPESAAGEREAVRVALGRINEDLRIHAEALERGSAKPLAAATRRLLSHLQALRAANARWRSAARG